MISKQHRFSRNKGIDYVYKKGGSARSGPFNIRFLESKSGYKLAVVVSKKVSKSAVVRNKIRRRVFEQLRKLFLETPPPNYEIVLSVYKEEVASMDTLELKKDLEKLIRNINIKRSV